MFVHRHHLVEVLPADAAQAPEVAPLTKAAVREHLSRSDDWHTHLDARGV